MTDRRDHNDLTLDEMRNRAEALDRAGMHEAAKAMRQRWSRAWDDLHGHNFEEWPND